MEGGAGGALARRPGGGGGGADELCFMPVLLALFGRERSGKEGLCMRGSSGGEARLLSVSSWGRMLVAGTGGRGAADLVPGTCSDCFPEGLSE